MSSFYFWFFLLAVMTYFVVTDSSIARAVDLLAKIAEIEYQKIKWWILHNPANPIVKYLMWRRAYKIAKELQDELKSQNK